MGKGKERRILTGSHFMHGDHACAEGAMAAGCTFFAGYPITPSTEVAERMAARLWEVGGTFIQMEDEMGSMAAILGASWGGTKAMTATSGPGFSLMMENIGLGFMTETPCVIVNVQRAGPSTGLPTMTAQSDVMQAKWGSHGDYEPIAYAPATSQEMFDLTVTAFNMAERFRLPVFIMAEELVGHLIERVVIPPLEDLHLESRKRPAGPPGDHLKLFEPGDDLVPPMPPVGEGYAVHVTGLTHDERGYPSMNPQVHDDLVRRLSDKVIKARDDIIEIEEVMLEDAAVVVVSYGSTSRAARQAVLEARNEGIPVGMIRLVTLWPFPGDLMRHLGNRVKAFVVAEVNLGQMAREVERFTSVPVLKVGHGGGIMLDPRDVLDAVRRAAP